MKHNKYRIIICVCLVVLLFAGCVKSVEPGAMGSEVWEQWPTLTYGTIETEKLAVLPWNSGRCEATTYNVMAETENGYYLGLYGHLYYADKAGKSSWVIVCNQLDCDHLDPTSCTSHVLGNNFVIKDNRIYYQCDSDKVPHLYRGRGIGQVLLSMAGDGTDKQLAYVLEDVMSGEGGSCSFSLSSEHWLYLNTTLDKDGSSTTRFFRITETGEQEVILNAVPNTNYAHYILPTNSDGLNGDSIFYCSALNETPGIYYRFVNNELQEVDLSKIELLGTYLAGNTLRCFRQNDGYYDIDLQTGMETRIAPIQLKNSLSDILLPNCIIESTLLWKASVKGRTEGIAHEMKLFDGEKWRSVKLPDELVNIKDTAYIYVKAVTSDSILFVYQDNSVTSDIHSAVLYRIPLAPEELVMEYYGEIIEPYEKEEE